MRKMMGDIVSPWKTPQVIGKTEVTQTGIALQTGVQIMICTHCLIQNNLHHSIPAGGTEVLTQM